LYYIFVSTFLEISFEGSDPTKRNMRSKEKISENIVFSLLKETDFYNFFL